MIFLPRAVAVDTNSAVICWAILKLGAQIVVARTCFSVRALKLAAESVVHRLVTPELIIVMLADRAVGQCSLRLDAGTARSEAPSSSS